MDQDQIIRRMGEVGGRLKVKSALNPILWLCAIVTTPALFVMPSFSSIPWWLILIAISPVLVAMAGFLFLLIFDRDKLQSEDYQIRKKTLELIQEKGDRFPILGTSINAITNPAISKPTTNRDEVQE